MSSLLARLRPTGFTPAIASLSQAGTGRIYAGATGAVDNLAAAGSIDKIVGVMRGWLTDPTGNIMPSNCGAYYVNQAAIGITQGCSVLLAPYPGGIVSTLDITTDLFNAPWTLDRVNAITDLRAFCFYPGGGQTVTLAVDDLYLEVWGTPFSGKQVFIDAGAQALTIDAGARKLDIDAGAQAFTTYVEGAHA